MPAGHRENCIAAQGPTGPPHAEEKAGKRGDTRRLIRIESWGAATVKQSTNMSVNACRLICTQIGQLPGKHNLGRYARPRRTGRR